MRKSNSEFINNLKFFLFLFLFIYLFIYLWLCWVFVSVWGLSLVAASGGHSSSRCAGLSSLRPLLLRSTGSRRAGSAIVVHGPSCSTACGILPDQGSNPCPLHWQADSQPLRHQGSPKILLYDVVFSHNQEKRARNLQVEMGMLLMLTPDDAVSPCSWTLLVWKFPYPVEGCFHWGTDMIKSYRTRTATGDMITAEATECWQRAWCWLSRGGATIKQEAGDYKD